MENKLDNPIWNKGYNAYHEGVPKDQNPYADDSEESELWEQGWERADADDDSDASE